MNDTTRSYTVRMINATGLSEAQRTAAELRFRMALEFGVGGADYVLPTLQACMLARSLLEDLTPDELASDDFSAEREVIAMWESAEDKAIMTALKPLNRDMGDARFEIKG
ncbi:MAG: hypothetical protein ABIV07_11975 [Polaromonas sp.]